MRTFVGALVIIALLLLGFLPTPSASKFLFPDYLLTSYEVSEPLRMRQHDIADIDAKISELVVQNMRKSADAALETDPDKKTKLSMEATLLSGLMLTLKERKIALEKQQSEMQKRLELAAVDATNLSLVIRALALGAIGALLSIFAKYLATTNHGDLFHNKSGFSRVPASMMMGALIAVVVVALFYTGFISIFSGAEKTTGAPDFWKVTLLSLIAGAFADRLFQAAAYKMEQYAVQFEKVERPTGEAATPMPRKPRARKGRAPAAENLQPKRSPPSLVTVGQSTDLASVDSDRSTKA